MCLLRKLGRAMADRQVCCRDLSVRSMTRGVVEKQAALAAEYHLKLHSKLTLARHDSVARPRIHP